jgi:hypothetical protein
MSTQTPSDLTAANKLQSVNYAAGAVPKVPTPIAEFAGLADFPECALGQLIDIGGFSGVLVNIVNQSIKVRSAEGRTQSFNTYRLRVLYGPGIPPESSKAK